MKATKDTKHTVEISWDDLLIMIARESGEQAPLIRDVEVALDGTPAIGRHPGGAAIKVVWSS